MFSLFLIVVAFIGGLCIGVFHTKVSAWLVRRAEANKIKAAQKLLDEYEQAKALIASKTPAFPPKLQV